MLDTYWQSVYMDDKDACEKVWNDCHAMIRCDDGRADEGFGLHREQALKFLGEVGVKLTWEQISDKMLKLDAEFEKLSLIGFYFVQDQIDAEALINRHCKPEETRQQQADRSLQVALDAMNLAEAALKRIEEAESKALAFVNDFTQRPIDQSLSTSERTLASAKFQKIMSQLPALRQRKLSRETALHRVAAAVVDISEIGAKIGAGQPTIAGGTRWWTTRELRAPMESMDVRSKPKKKPVMDDGADGGENSDNKDGKSNGISTSPLAKDNETDVPTATKVHDATFATFVFNPTKTLTTPFPRFFDFCACLFPIVNCQQLNAHQGKQTHEAMLTDKAVDARDRITSVGVYPSHAIVWTERRAFLGVRLFIRHDYDIFLSLASANDRKRELEARNDVGVVIMYSLKREGDLTFYVRMPLDAKKASGVSCDQILAKRRKWRRYTHQTASKSLCQNPEKNNRDKQQFRSWHNKGGFRVHCAV